GSGYEYFGPDSLSNSNEIDSVTPTTYTNSQEANDFWVSVNQAMTNDVNGLFSWVMNQFGTDPGEWEDAGASIPSAGVTDYTYTASNGYSIVQSVGDPSTPTSLSFYDPSNVLMGAFGFNLDGSTLLTAPDFDGNSIAVQSFANGSFDFFYNGVK